MDGILKKKLMKHLDDFLNEAAGENNMREIIQDLVAISNNSKLTNEIAAMLAKSLSREDFIKFKLFLNHAKNQQHIKVSASKRPGRNFPGGAF